MKINLQNHPAMWIGGLNENRSIKIKSLFKKLNYNDIFVQAIKSNNFNGNTKSTLKALELSLNYDSPVMIFEDDANITKWYKHEIDIPDDSDAIWLGTSIYGLVDNWKYMRLSENIFLKEPTIKDLSGDFFKIENMLSAHAILYISQKYKKDMINYLKYLINDLIAPDIVFAETMKNYNIYAAKYPMFFQDDSAHNSQPTSKPLIEIYNKR